MYFKGDTMSIYLIARCDDCDEEVYNCEGVNGFGVRTALKEAEDALKAHKCDEGATHV